MTARPPASIRLSVAGALLDARTEAMRSPSMTTAASWMRPRGPSPREGSLVTRAAMLVIEVVLLGAVVIAVLCSFGRWGALGFAGPPARRRVGGKGRACGA